LLRIAKRLHCSSCTVRHGCEFGEAALLVGEYLFAARHSGAEAALLRFEFGDGGLRTTQLSDQGRCVATAETGFDDG